MNTITNEIRKVVHEYFAPLGRLRLALRRLLCWWKKRDDLELISTPRAPLRKIRIKFTELPPRAPRDDFE